MEEKPVVINFYGGAKREAFPWKDGDSIEYKLRFAVFQRVLEENHHFSVINGKDAIMVSIYKR